MRLHSDKKQVSGNKIRTVLPGLVVIVAVVFAVVLPPAFAGGKTATVGMTNMLNFTPNVLTVKAGTTVVWKNTSLLVHTVTDDPAKAAKAKDAKLPAGAKAFDSGNLKPGGTFKHRFTVPGTYHYFCMPHEAAGMVGTVIVTKR